MCKKELQEFLLREEEKTTFLSSIRPAVEFFLSFFMTLSPDAPLLWITEYDAMESKLMDTKKEDPFHSMRKNTAGISIRKRGLTIVHRTSKR